MPRDHHHQQQQQQQQQQFAPFPRLPLEIRRLVWELALPRGRIQLFARAVPWAVWRLSPPAIAHASREAREVALGGAVVRGFPTAGDRHNETWFLGARDVLELASGYPYGPSNPGPFFAAAATLAVNAGDFGAGAELRRVLRDLVVVDRFPRVRTVYLIVDQLATPYWPRFRPDLTARDRGKGTLLDLRDDLDRARIAEYEAWARAQEMAPAFPRLEDVEPPLRARLDAAILQALLEHHRARVAPAESPAPARLSRNSPWVQQQWARLPVFRPAVLILGWT
ncbi:hypothetical protein F4780DRAFT_775218 [Xylariomycetidae sp. FL0641]|nr:hypothetical protein F4780DRAFT_775218 [Xylariomycetidae sp. FL0641]